MNVDQALIVVAISAYIVGALAFLTFLLTRAPAAKAFGIPFAFLGCVTQFAELVYRYASSHIWPLTNLYGSLSLFAAMSVAIFIGFALRYDLWLVGGFVLGLASVTLAYALTWNEGYLPPVPALQSYWIKIHVPIVVSSYAAFMVASALSVLYLIKHYVEDSVARAQRSPRTFAAAGAAAGLPVDVSVRMQTLAPEPQSAQSVTARLSGDDPAVTAAAAAGNPVAVWIAGLPSLAKIDIMTYRAVAVGLVLLSLGIITGAMWAREAWGAYWQWDPKETAALVSWILYASFMHLHTRRDWRGLRSAWLNIVGFASIVFCYLGVNIWISGLHSYKM